MGGKGTFSLLWKKNSAGNFVVFYVFCLAAVGTLTSKGGKKKIETFWFT